jgi:hypothetical protein
VSILARQKCVHGVRSTTSEGATEHVGSWGRQSTFRLLIPRSHIGGGMNVSTETSVRPVYVKGSDDRFDAVGDSIRRRP